MRRRPNSALISKKMASSLNRQESFISTEKEKLFEETVQHRITIKKLTQELNAILKEKKGKNQYLGAKDNELQILIQEIEKDHLIEDALPEDIKLMKKLRFQKGLIEKELQEIIEEKKNLKKNLKITKLNEFKIESEIFNDHFVQLSLLLDNNLKQRENQDKKLSSRNLLNQNLDNQELLIKNLNEALEREDKINSELKITLETALDKNEKMKKDIDKVDAEYLKLKKKNDILSQRKENSQKKSLDSYELELTKFREKLSFYKSKKKETEKIIKSLREEYLILERSFSESDPEIIKRKVPVKDCTEKIKKLKEILTRNKKKENELETIVFSCQDKLTSSIDFGLKKENPYFSASEVNDPLETHLFTNDQITEFTYILYKNFESRQISREDTQKLIVDETLKNEVDGDNVDNVILKFATNTKEVLHCDNNDDYIRLKIFFGALCYNYDGDSSKIVDSFLSLFNYLHFYKEEEIKRIINKIKTKYREKFETIKNTMEELFSISTSNRKYISILEMKRVFDKNPQLLKDKYIEFLFYYMKQFTDSKASLYDLSLEKFNELLQPKEEEDEEEEEISSKKYNQEINSSLMLLKSLMESENKKLIEFFTDNIVKIKNPPTSGVTIDSFYNKLIDKGVNLTELQLSCLYNKYCVNDELKAIDICQIEKDIEMPNIIEEDEAKENEDAKSIEKEENTDGNKRNKTN